MDVFSFPPKVHTQRFVTMNPIADFLFITLFCLFYLQFFSFLFFPLLLWYTNNHWKWLRHIFWQANTPLIDKTGSPPGSETLSRAEISIPLLHLLMQWVPDSPTTHLTHCKQWQLNAKGLNHSTWKEAQKQKADILCIQEMHFSASKTPKCTHKNYPHVFVSCAPEKKEAYS